MLSSYVIPFSMDAGSSLVDALAVSLVVRAKPKNPGVASSPEAQAARYSSAMRGQCIVWPSFLRGCPALGSLDVDDKIGKLTTFSPRSKITVSLLFCSRLLISHDL